jgi:type I restriction enzyme S subunit
VSRIDHLIADICPEGVEFRRLAEVAAYSDTRVDAADLDGTTFVGVDNLLASKGGKVNASYLPNTARLTAYEPGDILLGNIRPYLKKIWLATGRGGCSGDVLALRVSSRLRERLIPRFLYYLMSSDEFFAYDIQHAKGAKMPRGSKEAILRYRIPVPPVDVQREVVQALDLFTSLEAELEAELEARRRQYEYYRDSLLAFAESEGVRWTTMGDVGTFTRGRRFIKADVVPEGIGSIHYGEIYTQYGTSATEVVSRVRPELARSLRFAHTGDVVIAAVGETVDEVCKAVAWLGDEDVAVHDDCFIFRHSMNPKFVSYYFQTRAFHAEKAKHVARAKVKRVSGESLGRLKIPVPPIDEQERIVAILDKFDALVNDLSIGLPAEVRGRRKQYEHYRDRLLTFPQPT